MLGLLHALAHGSDQLLGTGLHKHAILVGFGLVEVVEEDVDEALFEEGAQLVDGQVVDGEEGGCEVVVGGVANAKKR